MVSIDATITSHFKFAAHNLKIEMPLIIQYFNGIGQTQWAQDLGGYEWRTINLILEGPLKVNKPDIITTPIKWHWHPQVGPESFAFLRMEFEYPLGGIRHPAAMIKPSGSQNYLNPFHLEIMAKLIPGVQLKTPCKVHLAQPHQSLPCPPWVII